MISGIENDQKNSELKYKLIKEKENLIEEEKIKYDERLRKQRKI